MIDRVMVMYLALVPQLAPCSLTLSGFFTISKLKRAELEDMERKRDALRERKLSRVKRGGRYFFEFDNGTTVTYINRYFATTVHRTCIFVTMFAS